MIKALKITMIAYSVIGILFGLGYIFIPGTLLGHGESSAPLSFVAALLSVSYISASIFVIIAARDPLKNILWVKYIIVLAILNAIAELYSYIMGNLVFWEALADIILHSIFAAALLAFYPWRKVRSEN